MPGPGQKIGSPTHRVTIHTTPTKQYHTPNNTQRSVQRKEQVHTCTTRRRDGHTRNVLTRERPLKQVSRVATLLEKHYTCAFTILNVLSQQHMITGFLEPARQYFRETKTPVWGGGGGGELDVVRMFPSLKREKIVSAHERLLKRWRPQLDLQCACKDVHISVAKTSAKRMDAVGVKGTSLWNTYTVQEYLQLAFANLFLNNYFVMGDTLMRQAEGTAIGGPTSAQDADICPLADESDVRWGTTVPLSLRIARFRDNIMFLCPLDQCEFWSHHLKRFLTDLYGLELDYEQMGRGLTFLEVEVWCDGCNVEWGLKNKVLSGLMTKNPPIQRYPAPHDKDAATHVPGLAMAVGMKACKIATSPQRVHSNFAHAIWEFRHLQYPRRWWDPHLHAWYKKSTARMPWSDLQQSLQWLVPVPAKMCILDPTVQQPVCGLVGENTVHILQSAWADMPLLTLKSAVQLPVKYSPEGMHKPRAQRKKPATAT